MYDYIKGIVTYVKYNSIVVDNNGVGYLIHVSNPYSFNIGDEYKVYVYQHVGEDLNELYALKIWSIISNPLMLLNLKIISSLKESSSSKRNLKIKLIKIEQ